MKLHKCSFEKSELFYLKFNSNIDHFLPRAVLVLAYILFFLPDQSWFLTYLSIEKGMGLGYSGKYLGLKMNSSSPFSFLRTKVFH